MNVMRRSPRPPLLKIRPAPIQEERNPAVLTQMQNASLPAVLSQMQNASLPEFSPTSYHSPEDEIAHQMQLFKLQVHSTTVVDWRLPLGLEYPLPDMRQQETQINACVDEELVILRRDLDQQHNHAVEELNSVLEGLEDEVRNASTIVGKAEENARYQEEQRAARAERRRTEEAERRAREERRRREEEAAKRLRAEQEKATVALLAQANEENGAGAIGERGDMRMCGRCRAGPIINHACSDLAAHNDASTSYKNRRVASKAKPNDCPNCGWFNADWHNWPRWDGVYGPHCEYNRDKP